MKTTRMKYMLGSLCCSIGVVVFTSCSTVKVSLQDEATGIKKQIPDQPESHQRVSTTALGERSIPVQDRDGDKAYALHSVVIHNNPFYDLLGFLTFGLWHPMEVDYYLTDPHKTTQPPN